MKLLVRMCIYVRSEEESELRQSEAGDGDQEYEAHLTGSSSQGIMGITWARNGLAVPVMRAAGRKDAPDLARGTWLDGRAS